MKRFLTTLIAIIALFLPGIVTAQTFSQFQLINQPLGGGVVVSTSTKNGDHLGTIATSSLGLLTTNVAEGSNLYFTTARALSSFITNLAATTSVASITTLPNLSLPYSQLTGAPSGATFGTTSIFATTPLQWNTTTATLSILQAGTSQNGYLSSTDWNTFNNKSGFGYLFPGNATTSALTFGGITLTGAATGCATFTSGVLSSTGVACGSGSGSSFPFTPTTNYGAAANSTSTPIFFTAGIQASTTANFFAGLTVDGGAATAGALSIIGHATNVGSSLLISDLNTAGNTLGDLINPSGTSNVNLATVPLSATIQTGSGTTGGLIVFNKASAPIIFATGGNAFVDERLNITGTGNVGVGSTSPFGLLSVGTANVGNFIISTSTSGCAQFSAIGEIYSTGSACGTGTGGVTSVTATNPLFSSGGTTPNITTIFSTTTTFGLGNNGFLVFGPTGIPFSAASSTLNLPNTALQNSLVTVNGTSIALGASGTVTANTPNAVTFNSSGSGGSSPQIFNGSSAETISYNTIGAQVAGTYDAVVTATTPIIRSLNNLIFVGLATTSQPASSNILTSNGAAGVYGTATTSATCTGNATCSAFTILGSTPVTINVAAGTAASSTLLGDTNTFSGTDIFSNTIKVAALSGFVGGNSGTLYNFATSTIKTSQLTNDAGFITSGGIATTSLAAAAPITLTISSGFATFGTSFSTSTFNAFSAENTFTNLFATNASSTNATTTNLAITGVLSCGGTSALTTNSSGNVGCTAQPQGTVTSVAVATANGFAGSSSGGSTPSLTLTTTVTGLLKGNGTAISAATPGTDYDVFGYPFPAGATSSPVTFTGLITTTNASTTLFSSTYASSTRLFAGSLTLSTTTAGCLNTSSGGVVYAATCSAGGSSFPFTPTNNFGINTNATSTTVSFFAGLFASSTSIVGSTTFAVGGNVGIASSTPWAPFSMFPVINSSFNNLVQSSTSVWSTAGTYTWVPPTGAASVIVQAWGGGGGGGGDLVSQGRGGGGGGAGAYVASTTVTLSPLTTSVTLIVGGGGGGGSNLTGGAGGTGFGAGAAGVSNNSSGGGGGGSSAFGSAVIACGGGGGGGEDSTGNNSGLGGSGATGNSGGAGATAAGTSGGAGGGGGCSTAGSGTTGGTGGTTQTGTNGSGGTIAGVGSGGGGSSAGVGGNGTSGTGASGGGAGGVGSGGAAAGANGVGPNSGGGGNGGSSGNVGAGGGTPGAGAGGSQTTSATTGAGGSGMVIITTMSYTNFFTPLFAQMFSTQEPVLVGGVNQFGSTTIGVGTSSPQATFDIYSSTNAFGAFMVHIVQNGVRYVAEEIDSVGHLITGGKAPTVSSCGSSPSVMVPSNDRNMTINIGSGVTSSCTITWANPYPTGTVVVCPITFVTGTPIAINASTTLTGMVVSGNAITSDRLQFHCEASQ